MILKAIILIALLAGIHSQISLCVGCARSYNGVCVQCSSCTAYASVNPKTNICACKQGYYYNSLITGSPYCDRCFIGCLTCAGPLQTNCLSCSSNFTYDSVNSICDPPTTTNDTLIDQVYYFDGFNPLSTWGNSVSSYQCGYSTLLSVSAYGTIAVTYNSLQAHFQLRVMFAIYYISATSVSTSVVVTIGTASNTISLVDSNSQICNGAGFVMFPVDSCISQSAASGSSATISIYSSAGYQYGIREFILINKLCNSTCATCLSYTGSDCLTCTDTNRIAIFSSSTNIANGTCLCYGSSAQYYAQPTNGQCVEICPSVPVQYFGDNTTRNCVTSCPTGFAYADLYRCWADCPTTSTVTLQPLYRDYVNMRCVTNCPPSAPYANPDDRKCYSTCPSGYFALNGVYLRCVTVCPNNATYTTFGYQGACVALCPNGTWGDPGSNLCVSNCTNTSYLYKDSSSGQNLCVFNCSDLNYFRDNSTYTCVLVCPGTLYGDITRECVTRCGNPRFGLPIDNRKCVTYCPAGYWGQPVNNVCVNITNQCNPNYADNYTRQCVVPTSCALGAYAYNVTWACVPVCYNQTVGHPVSKICQAYCLSPYFADFTAGLCVTNCLTTNTFADVYSNRSCVTACNSSGLTPWAQPYTMTCVSSCNSTGIATFVADNTTWSCVFNCPPNYYADRITLNASMCMAVCLSNTYADNSTGTGLCVYICSAQPVKFGDATGGMNLCVSVCSLGLYGDQIANRTCISSCPSGYFAQNDSTRQCVSRCKPGTYGYNNFCLTNPLSCPNSTFADDQNNLCDGCNSSLSTFGDPVSGRCVLQCQTNSNTSYPIVYYADISIRQCVFTCNASYITGATTNYSTGLWGDNNTRTCVFICTDINAFAEPLNNPFRVCVAMCSYTHYANNQTKVCGPSINCPLYQFGQNTTRTCMSSCPNGSFAYQTSNDKICIDICPLDWFGDTSTGHRICVTICPAIPPLYADNTTKLCVSQCPSGYFATSTNRSCVNYCPTSQYSYTPNLTCVGICPSGYYGKMTSIGSSSVGSCVTPSSACGAQLGDPYLHLCVGLCTGPTPVSLFAYSSDCVSVCPSGYYANSYNNSRTCVQLCPPGVVGLGTPNLYGDPSTISCVSNCVTPLTWADFQTRLCTPIGTCSASPSPTYSQNFGFTCVISLNCPTLPSMTFGDNSTRSCVTNCSSGWFGDLTTRNCVQQCPNTTTTGTSNYYGDTSTGQYICVVICPQQPVLFGQNQTNLCVYQCPYPNYGDQTGNRTCVPTCPLIGSLVYFAQNSSRICVTVCTTSTWGLISTRECVQNPFYCLTQWADNTTNLCVTTCPLTANTFGDPTTRFCVTLCPSTYFSDYYTRTCVQTCPYNVYIHGTFGNNATRVCEQECSPINGTITYADPQTVNRFCVLLCSQSPDQAFADPSTSTCVPICPVSPSLYGDPTTFKCVSNCPSGYYADTNSRQCTQTCPTSPVIYYRQINPNVCVAVCSAQSTPALFGDTYNASYCASVCSNSNFRYTTLSICVPDCSVYGLFAYNFTCVEYCPRGYYADPNNKNICGSSCTSTLVAENSTTKCQSGCSTGFASNGYCVAVCPNGSYGQNFICQTTCQIAGNIASNISNLCISTCTNTTFSQSGSCVPTCASNSYADPNTHTCSTSSPPCTGGLFGNPTTNTCVQLCPAAYYADSTGYCLSTCTSKFADNITWTCTTQCSNGTWGYNNLCVSICPINYYAYTVNRICYTIPNRPVSSPIYFADNSTQTWVQVCPLSPLTFGDTTLKECVTTCPSGKYANPASRRCDSSCAGTTYFADSITNECVVTCPLSYYGNSNNNNCQNICSSGYAFDLERICVGTCPAPYSGYNNGTAQICVLRCPASYYAYQQVCQTNCPSPYYADNSSNMCVLSCLNSFASNDSNACVSSCALFTIYNLADNSTNQCVTLCPTYPDYYSQNNLCLMSCSPGKYADPAVGVRKCTSLCTDGSYADPLSGRCLTMCLPGYYAQNVSNICVQTCASNTFADNLTGYCVTTCPYPTFADSLTNRCVKTCPSLYYGQDLICVAKCTLPNYANPLNRLCQTTCPEFDYLYAENTTASCVNNCSIVPISYSNDLLQACVGNCSISGQYSVDGLGICTSLCPPGLFMENSTMQCLAVCLTGFAQPTTRYCVARCFGAPQTFGYQKVCYYRCLNSSLNYYADNSTNLCVQTCPTTPPYFSDPLTGNCVLFCADGYFAENTTRTCTTSCLVGYADNLTRKCVLVCPTVSQQTYGDPTTNKCVRVCPSNMYAQNVSQTCVNYNNCPTNTWSDPISKYCVLRCPSQPLSFGYNYTTSCVPTCPASPDLFGDFISQTCISPCTAVNGQYRYADPISRTCLFVCPITNGLFGDLTNNSCVYTCANGGIRDNSTQRCVTICPINPSYWADLTQYFCVAHCPTPYFASNQTDRLCVSSCSVYLTFGDQVQNLCSYVCPPLYYADNSTYLCVSICPTSPDYYADNTTSSCVLHCPDSTNWKTFADPTTRRCVTECPQGYFAQNSSGRCVTGCPTNEYADPIIRVCVEDCTVRPHYYKTNALTCVYQCPTAPVMAYMYNVDHTCVYTDSSSGNTGCPGNYYANPIDFTCTTLCPQTYFADLVLNLCVPSCQLDTWADPVIRQCVGTCSSAPQYYRLSHAVGTCVQYCPSPYFADNTTYNCVVSCPAPLMFMYSPTNQCVYYCPPPYYSYLPDGVCRVDCPTGYFQQDSNTSCVTACLSPFFADNSTNRCVMQCPIIPNYYGMNQVCVSYCPAGTYRDYSTRLCVIQCPNQPILFADNSTNTCVANCPSSPNYFGENITNVCVFYCPNNTFADVSSRTCVSHCPTDLDTYADPTTGVCQPACPSPYYASDLTKQCVTFCPNVPVKTYALNSSRYCATGCPNGLFGQNISRTCATGCPTDLTAFADTTTNLCVSTCPFGWFADNDTFSCVINCPLGSFADNYTRKCLQACPGTLKEFADGSTNRCVVQCPNLSYGDDQNWTCIPNCPSQAFGYKLNLGNLCIQQCPSPYFAYVPTRTCVINCGAGLYGDLASRTCMNCPTTCPTCLSLTQCLTCISNNYLSFGGCVTKCATGNYANNQTWSCVYPLQCQSGHYGNNVTGYCDTTCPIKQYPNPITKMCEVCPYTCASCTSLSVCLSCIEYAIFSNSTNQCYAWCSSTLQYNYQRNCFASCPDGSYLDYTQVNCQTCNQICLTCTGSATNCNTCDTTFYYNNTCLSQCPKGYYAANQTCLICNSQIPSCQNPLSFTVVSTQQNYQNVVYIQFNQPVVIKGDPSSYISVNLNVNSRRMQTDYSSLVNDGVPYTATVMPDGTIKLVLAAGVTLTNPSFSVVINDPTQITTTSGDTLQTLSANLDNIVLQSYPTGSTSDAPLVVAGTVLSIFLLILLFSVALCTPSPVFLTLEAFQMIAFYAYVSEIPPNLFYFLQNLSLTRLGFLPNVFSGIYTPPQTYNSALPTRITDVNGVFSFAVSAGSFFFCFIVYLLLSALIYFLGSKHNSNRPMRELFSKIYLTRVKFGIVNDFLWMFALNVFVCGFMQFLNPTDGSDMALAVISLISFLVAIIGLFVYRIKKYDPQNTDDFDNFRLIHDGSKQGVPNNYIIFIYYLRKILFAVLLTATISVSSIAMDICLVLLSSIMLILLIILRPYNDHLRNFLHIANEVGLTFLGGGFLYYNHYVTINEPIGTKIICGTILTSVIIFHLGVALIWGAFRTYNFYKQLYRELQNSEFYKLYLDEKYDESLEKQLQSLNDQTGQIQSVDITNVQDGLENRDEGQQTIKLKIRRRRKKISAEDRFKAAQRVPVNQKRMGDYIKLERENSIQQIILPIQKKDQGVYEKMNIGKQDVIISDLISEASNRQKGGNQGDWVQFNHSQERNPDEIISHGKDSNIFELQSQEQMGSPRQEIMFSPRQEYLISPRLQQPENEVAASPRQDLIQLDEVKQTPEKQDQPLHKESQPLMSLDQISSVEQKQEILSKDEVQRQSIRESLSHIRFKEVEASQEISMNEGYQIQQSEVGQSSDKYSQALQHQDIQLEPQNEQNKESIIKEEEPLVEDESRQDWRKEDWQPIESGQKINKNNDFVIDLDLDVEQQKKMEGKENEGERSKNEKKWQMQIEDLLDEEEKKQLESGTNNKKHLLYFDEEDFD